MPDQNQIVFAKSSNITSATFDPASGELVVEFQNGNRYRYQNFTPELVEEFRKAESPGKWFNNSIKAQPEKYPAERIEDAQRSAAQRSQATTDASASVSAQASMLAENPSTLPADATPAPAGLATPNGQAPASTTDPTPRNTAAAGNGQMVINPDAKYTEGNPVTEPLAPAALGGRHITKKDIGPPGSKAARQTAIESGNATSGIAAANSDGKAAIADTQKAHEARKARQWQNRPWKNGPNGTTSPAK